MKFVDFFRPQPYRDLEKAQKDEKSGKPEVSAEGLRAQRQKLEKAIEKGEINHQEGVGKAVDTLEDYVLKNMTNELHKLSLDEVGDLIKKFDLPYEKEAVLLVAQAFADQRKEQ